MEEINRSSLDLFGKILHQIRIRLVKVKEMNSGEEKRVESSGKPNNSQQITTQGCVLPEGNQEPTLKKENDQSDVATLVTAAYDSDTDIEGFTNENETVKTEDEADTEDEELQHAGGSISAEELKLEEKPEVGSINGNVGSGHRIARSALRGSGRHKCTFCNKRFKSAYYVNVHIQNHLNKKEFKCTQCEKAFNTRNLLQTHLKVHLGVKKHECKICGKKFLRMWNVRRHAVVHNATRKFQCKKCDRWFKSQGTLIIHEKWHHSEATVDKKLACDTCGKTFSRHGNLIRHVAIHLNKKEFQCTVCEKRFNIKDSLRIHMKSHDAANGIPTKKHTCEICGRKFNRKDILTRHTASCLNIRAIKCPICGAGFNSNTAVKSHLLVHDEGKNYTCEICGRAFKRRGGLRDHVKTHLNEKSHKCKICGKGFNTSSAMAMHARMHVETKDYSCEICGKVYKWKHALRDHKVTHSEEKRYQCTECNKSFHTGAKLTSHKAYCSTGMECPVCHEAIIGGKRQLQIHMKIHPFTCEICGKVFTRKELLKRHNEIHLNERKYVCELCDKAYNTKSQLCTHKNRVHKIGSGGAPITSSQEVLYRL